MSDTVRRFHLIASSDLHNQDYVLSQRTQIDAMNTGQTPSLPSIRLGSSLEGSALLSPGLQCCSNK